MFIKLMRFLNPFKYNTHPVRIEMKSRKLVMFGASKAFDFFKDQKFRELVKFDKLSEEEQNRIFNELVVTNLILLMLLIDRFIIETDRNDQKEYYNVLRQGISESFNTFIGGLGIPENLISIWKKLVDLRYNEYTDSAIETRGEFLKHDNEKMREHAMDYKAMIFQAIAIGLYDHIMRGKIKPKDPLYLYIQEYLLGVYTIYMRKA